MSTLTPRRRFQTGGENDDAESGFFGADTGGAPPAVTTTLTPPAAPTPAPSPLAPPGAPKKQPPPTWLRTLMGAGLGAGLGAQSGAGALGGMGLAALLTYLGSKYNWGHEKPASTSTGTTGTTTTTPTTTPTTKARGGRIGGKKVRTGKMRFQDGGAVPPVAGSLTGLPPTVNPMANAAMMQALQGAGGAAGPPPGGPPPAGVGGPPPSAMPLAGLGAAAAGAPPPSPAAMAGALQSLGAASPGVPGPPAGLPPGGPPPAGPPAGLPASALQASLGALPQPATPVVPPAVAQSAASTPTAGAAALRGRRAYAKGGGVQGEDQKGDNFAAKKKTDRQWGKSEGPEEPIAKKKGGKVSAKGKAPVTKRPKVAIAISTKKAPAPMSPSVYEDDEGTAPTVAPPSAPAAPPMMAKGGALKRNKGGVVIRKAKGGECDKMAAGGAAKVRHGFPKTIAQQKKAFAKGGKVRGCGIAKRGCTFQGVF